MAKFCGKCGAPLGAGDFCPRCGAYFGSQQSTPQNAAHSSALPTNQKRGHKGLALLVALVFVVVFACSAVLILGAIRADLPPISTKKETRFDQLIYDPELTVTETFTPQQVFPFDAGNVSDHNGADSMQTILSIICDAIATRNGDNMVKYTHPSVIMNYESINEMSEQEIVDKVNKEIQFYLDYIRDGLGGYEDCDIECRIDGIGETNEYQLENEKSYYGVNIETLVDFIVDMGVKTETETFSCAVSVEFYIAKVENRWYLWDSPIFW